MKKSVLLFGANSFVAREFIKGYSDRYNLHPVYRKAGPGELAIDFTDGRSVDDFCKRISFPVDAVIFLQGINPSNGFKDITEAQFVDMLLVNLVTPTMLIRGLLPQLTRNSSVTFFSSVSKRKGSYDPSYATAKAGLQGLIQSLANSNANVRFNSISLGLVENSPVYKQMTDDFRKRHAGNMSNGRFVQAQDVCAAIDMLLQNESINRADIPVDNGHV